MTEGREDEENVEQNAPSGSGGGSDAGPLGVLQKLLHEPAPEIEPEEEPPGRACEMCGAELGDRHGHVVDVRGRSLMCTCRPCSLLFEPEGAGGGRFKGVPDRYLELEAPVLTKQQWDRMQIPVGMAFFFYNTSMEEVVAQYPSPGGATESELDLEEWDEIVSDNPVLESLMPDVEALLVRDTDDDFTGYVVPIVDCYELVGHMRLSWKGFAGGEEARQRIDEFFEEVSSKARSVGGETDSP